MRITAASAALTVACAVSLWFTARATDVFRGLGGAEIVECIRREYRPETIVDAVYGPDGVLAVIEEYAGADADWLPEASDGGEKIFMEVVPVAWWPADVRPPRDLHNVIPANSRAFAARDNLIFAAAVTDTLYAGAGWVTGSADVGAGVFADAFCPPDGLRGDMARMLMYMACVYPSQLWRWPAPLMMPDSPDYPPLFTDYAVRLLMDWHRGDAPDAVELRRDAAIARRQGNSNPFVVYPELAEYLWGEKCGQVVEDAPTADESPALKARYSVSVDRRLGLHSPYVDKDMLWSVDGVGVSPDPGMVSLPLEAVGVGRHEVSWRSADGTVSGSIIVDVMP